MIMPFIIPTTLTLKQFANLLRQMRCQRRVELVFLKIELQLVLHYERVYNVARHPKGNWRIRPHHRARTLDGGDQESLKRNDEFIMALTAVIWRKHFGPEFGAEVSAKSSRHAGCL